jgi:hypothetical protein
LSGKSDDLDEAVEPGEIVGVPGVERKIRGACSGCNQQVNGSGATGLSAGGNDRRVDPAVCACCVSVKGQRIEHSLSSLETILAASALVRIGRCVWSSGEFGHGDRADCNFDRQLRW